METFQKMCKTSLKQTVNFVSKVNPHHTWSVDLELTTDLSRRVEQSAVSTPQVVLSESIRSTLVLFPPAMCN